MLTVPPLYANAANVSTVTILPLYGGWTPGYEWDDSGHRGGTEDERMGDEGGRWAEV